MDMIRTVNIWRSHDSPESIRYCSTDSWKICSAHYDWWRHITNGSLGINPPSKSVPSSPTQTNNSGGNFDDVERDFCLDSDHDFGLKDKDDHETQFLNDESEGWPAIPPHNNGLLGLGGHGNNQLGLSSFNTHGHGIGKTASPRAHHHGFGQHFAIDSIDTGHSIPAFELNSPEVQGGGSGILRLSGGNPFAPGPSVGSGPSGGPGSGGPGGKKSSGIFSPGGSSQTSGPGPGGNNIHSNLDPKFQNETSPVSRSSGSSWSSGGSAGSNSPEMRAKPGGLLTMNGNTTHGFDNHIGGTAAGPVTVSSDSSPQKSPQAAASETNLDGDKLKAGSPQKSDDGPEVPGKPASPQSKPAEGISGTGQSALESCPTTPQKSGVSSPEQPGTPQKSVSSPGQPTTPKKSVPSDLNPSKSPTNLKASSDPNSSSLSSVEKLVQAGTSATSPGGGSGKLDFTPPARKTSETGSPKSLPGQLQGSLKAANSPPSGLPSSDISAHSKQAEAESQPPKSPISTGTVTTTKFPVAAPASQSESSSEAKLVNLSLKSPSKGESTATGLGSGASKSPEGSSTSPQKSDETEARQQR